MLKRTLFEPEHDRFRDQFKKFIEAEIAPRYDEWDERQQVDRELWTKAGAQGYLCPTIPGEYGGAGVDRRFSQIIIEELAYANVLGATGGFPVHSDIVAPYVHNFGTEDQKRAWLPKMASGEAIGAIAMTEPGTGSDLQNIKTKVVPDGNEMVLSGSKIFITNGYLADIYIVAAKLADPSGKGDGRLTLFLVEAGRDGFTKEAPLKKLGQHGQDTCILHFDDVRLPAASILGGEESAGKGIAMLFGELPWERLIIAIMAVAGARYCLDEAVRYTRERKAFGQPIADFQDIRFKLADMRASVNVGQAYVDQCMVQLGEGGLTDEDASTAKLWCSEMAFEVADRALQMHGGYGYMREYGISRAFADIRAHRIYGGANEIMKELIARSL